MLKTTVRGDFEFDYLKWILNNLNHIQTLKLRLSIDPKYGMDNMLCRCVIDANFVYRYCMPDSMVNLINFDFYISTECKLEKDDIENIIYSFKIHPVFTEHQWTNVKCFFDPELSHQHLASSIIRKPPFLNGLM